MSNVGVVRGVVTRRKLLLLVLHRPLIDRYHASLGSSTAQAVVPVPILVVVENTRSHTACAAP